MKIGDQVARNGKSVCKAKRQHAPPISMNALNALNAGGNAHTNRCFEFAWHFCRNATTMIKRILVMAIITNGSSCQRERAGQPGQEVMTAAQKAVDVALLAGKNRDAEALAAALGDIRENEVLTIPILLRIASDKRSPDHPASLTVLSMSGSELALDFFLNSLEGRTGLEAKTAALFLKLFIERNELTNEQIRHHEKLVKYSLNYLSRSKETEAAFSAALLMEVLLLPEAVPDLEVISNTQDEIATKAAVRALAAIKSANTPDGKPNE